MLIEIKNNYYNVLSIEKIDKPHAYFCVFKDSDEYYGKTIKIEDAENMSIFDDGKYVIVNNNDGLKFDLNKHRYEIIYFIEITFKNKDNIIQTFSTLEEAVLYRNGLVNKVNNIVSDVERFNKLNKMLKELFVYE